MTKKNKKLLLRIAVSFVLFVIITAVTLLAEINGYITLIMYLVPYFIAGYDVLIASAKNIARGKVFDEQFLMMIATVGALIIGEYPESVFVMLFYQTGELFQNIAVGNSRKKISELMELCPDEATVIRDEGEETVFTEEIEEGETVLVRAGDKIPVDGIVISGEGALDMKALTGESAPVDIFPDCEVKAGSISLTGTLRIRCTRQYSDSTAAKILELVENSSLNKAKTEKFLTKFSRYYTPAVVILALLIAVIPSIITGNVTTWVYRALIFLVVSCPCAVVISVPLSYFSGIGAASSRGILIKGASFLEALGNADTFVFDKTGTLTTGEFEIDRIYPEKGFSEESLLEIAATAEYYSAHPLARAIVKAQKKPTPPDSSEESAGNGVKASHNGRLILAGSRRFLEKNGITITGDVTGNASVSVAVDGSFAGTITLFDSPRKNSGAALEALKKIGIKRLVMLTGDKADAAKKTALQLGIDEWRDSLLPDGKATEVQKLLSEKAKGRSLAFVGDGINDAPVLAVSDVGIAMGGIGSDAAIEAADVVIMDDDPEKCAVAVQIAKKTKTIVIQNIIFALTVKFAVLIFAAFGLTSMWLGVIADVGVAIIAILNATRKKRTNHRL